MIEQLKTDPSLQFHRDFIDSIKRLRLIELSLTNHPWNGSPNEAMLETSNASHADYVETGRNYEFCKFGNYYIMYL